MEKIVKLASGETFKMEFNGAQAAAGIWYQLEDGEEWEGTPFQVADARHNDWKAAKMVAEWLGFDSSVEEIEDVEDVGLTRESILDAIEIEQLPDGDYVDHYGNRTAAELIDVMLESEFADCETVQDVLDHAEDLEDEFFEMYGVRPWNATWHQAW